MSNGKMVQGQELSDTQHVGATYASPPATYSFKPDYPLREAEYANIKNGDSKLLKFVPGVFYTILGYGLSLGHRFFQDMQSIKDVEWMVLGGGFGVWIALLIISRFLPHDRKTVMKSIEDHFSKAELHRGFYEKEPQG